MKVPEYQTSVNLAVPEVPMPHPANAVRGAFGEEVFAANARIGEAGMKIAQVLGAHLAERQQQKDAAATAELDTNFRLNLQDQLLSDQPEKFNINGVDYERPKGLLNQNLEYAAGATERFDKYMKEEGPKWLASAPESMREELKKSMNNQYLSAREKIIQHEGKQGRDVLVKSQVSSLNQQIHDAAGINDPINLQKAVDQIKQTQDQISSILGSDAQTAETNRMNKAGDLVSKSISSTLMGTGNLELAQGMLDSAKEDIQPDRYEKLNEMLATGAERLQKQQVREVTQANIAYEADIMTKLASGQLDWSSIDQISNEVRSGVSNEKFSAAVIDVVEEQGDYEPSEKDNANYPKYIEGVYNAKSQEELHQKLLTFLQNHKDISQEKLSVLINEAIKRGKNLPLMSEDQIKNTNDIQTGIDLGVKAGLDFGRRQNLSAQDTSDIYQDYVKELSSGKTPQEAHTASLNNYALRKNPALQSIPEEGQMMIDAQGNKAMVFPDGSWKEIAAKPAASTGNPGKNKKEKKPNAVQSK